MFEKFEKNALKGGESDIGYSGKKGIKTFDDLANEPREKFNTFDDISKKLLKEDENKPKTYDDFRVDSKNGINTFDDLRKESAKIDSINLEKARQKIDSL